MLVNPMTFKQESGGGVGLPPLDIRAATTSFSSAAGFTLENGKLHAITGNNSAAILLPDIWDISNGETWEYGCKVEIEQSVAPHNPIFAAASGAGAYYATVPTIQYYNQDKKFVFGVPSGNTTWKYLMYTTRTYEYDNTYYIKCGWDGNEYYIDVSTDGNTWVRDAVEADATPCYYNSDVTYRRIGLGRLGASTAEYFNSGNIILPECYVKINGVVVWGKA